MRTILRRSSLVAAADRLNEIARLAQQCRDSGVRYVLTTPPGYLSASYWCIFDEEGE